MHILALTTDDIGQWSRAQTEPEWLTAQRQQAWQEFGALPPPPRFAEAWKYTNLEKLGGWQQTTWPALPPAADRSCATADLPRGVICCDLGEAIREHAELVRPYLTLDAPLRGAYSSVCGTTYGGLRYLRQQEALWDRGLFLYVPRNVHIAAPVTARITSRQDGVAIFPRTIVVLEEGAEVTLIETFQSDPSSPHTTTSCHARAEFYCGAGSRLHHVAVQNWHRDMRHLAHQHARVGRDARYQTHAIALGSKVAKQINEVVLAEPGADATMSGLSFGSAAQQIDHHTLQTHLAPHTASNLLYKTVLKDTAVSVYTGLIRMAPAAQQATAYQASRNLLLSEQCAANAIPQLEIEANDVKCSHGATMGPVDEEQCFYLMSRGCSRPDAETMIALGFFGELLQRIPDAALVEDLHTTIAEKLAG